jgi:hypothetical protein
MKIKIPSQMLMRIVLNHKADFYNQDWYYDEDFAYVQHPPMDVERATLTTNLIPAAAWAWLYANRPIDMLHKRYVWTSDYDKNGDQVYVGGVELGRRYGFEIHRYLTIRPEMFVNTPKGDK